MVLQHHTNRENSSRLLRGCFSWNLDYLTPG
nr:MAG TPA: hypothetical protein [Caudoviricetes sp.]